MTKITIKNNSAIKIEGDDFELYDQEGNKFDLNGRTIISLCRCAMSKEMPLCDGTHKTCGFESEVRAFTLPPKPAK